MSAMVEVREHIEAPVDRVFAAASDFAGAAEFISGIERVEMLTDGPVGVGTRFRETRVMFGKQATEEMEVSAFDVPRAYALSCENHGCSYLSELTFEESGTGTDVTMRFEATPLTFFAKIMGFLTKPLLKSMVKTCAKDLADLKTAVEGRAAA